MLVLFNCYFLSRNKVVKLQKSVYILINFGSKNEFRCQFCFAIRNKK